MVGENEDPSDVVERPVAAVGRQRGGGVSEYDVFEESLAPQTLRMEEESLKVIVEKSPSLLAYLNSYAAIRSDNAASSSSTTFSSNLEAAVCTTNDIVARTFSVLVIFLWSVLNRFVWNLWGGEN